MRSGEMPQCITVHEVVCKGGRFSWQWRPMWGRESCLQPPFRPLLRVVHDSSVNTSLLDLTCRFAGNQYWVDQNCFRRTLALGTDGFDQHICGLLADSAAALVDSGERHAQQVGVMDVADADHLDLLRNGDARFENGLHGARGGRVVVAGDGIRTRLAREQTARGEISAGLLGGMRDG